MPRCLSPSTNGAARNCLRTARNRVRNARAEAAGALLTQVALPEAAALREAAGLPDANQAVSMATTLRERLWLA